MSQKITLELKSWRHWKVEGELTSVAFEVPDEATPDDYLELLDEALESIYRHELKKVLAHRMDGILDENQIKEIQDNIDEVYTEKELDEP